ncbi:NAD(P)H-hydrate dehydratase [Ferrimonas balearica]|uniref:NAD(P)H-hydrate dehydratase n=1 Tax=Ferrimonas balearica TaxID=44012 RepID=UPI001C99A40D|nr:NAD(P)H-hydrate dehydratase [Ferrimonas balearica]MBY5923063.1 NAD(P)H-hydrate dehydratase [Ferrimonas balearica]MBY5997561.1 NAD(P)H-hydrate dehydratase [Ferrimonas balearica]
MRADLALIPSSLFHADLIRQREPELAAALDIPLYDVMEAAGKAAWECVAEHWPEATRLLVICGRGNNGGDGYVLARLARAAGKQVTLLQAEPERPLSGDAATAQAAFLAEGGQLESLAGNWPEVDLVVDGLLGTGLSGTLNASMRVVIERINHQTAPVLALDLPSGLSGQSGQALPVAVEATRTITFVGTKPGLLTGAAPAYVGELSLAPLQLGPELAKEAPSVIKCALDDYLPLLRPRRVDSHKGDHGKVVILGGQAGMAGAVRLAGEAALRSGAGLVAVVSWPENLAQIQAGRPELMTLGVDVVDMEVYAKLGWANAIAVGPGMGQSDWARHLLIGATRSERPLVVDADALNLLARTPEKRDNWVLTPHPGEAARLLGQTIESVQDDRFAAVEALQQRYGGVVVLKGAGTLIHDGKQCYLAPVGNPGLATGGSGDLLSGIIASLLAQGLSPLAAACCGVCVHGEAADAAAVEGQRGMLASDLLPHIRHLVNP